MKSIILFLLFGFLGFAFTNKMEVITHSIPPYETLIIDYYQGGGMLPYSKSIYISKDSAFIEVNEYLNVIHYSWKPSSTELKGLYTILIANKYNKIEEKQPRGTVYDRGGSRIRIVIGGETTLINNSGSSFLKEKWYTSYNNIVDKVISYADSKK